MRRIASVLTSRGRTGFGDPKLSFADLVAARDAERPSWEKSRTVLGHALRAHHPDGDRLAEMVVADRLIRKPVVATIAYDEAGTRAIEASARAWFFRRVGEHKRALGAAGIDTSVKSWLFMSPDEVIENLEQGGSPMAARLAAYLESGKVADSEVAAVVNVTASDLAAAAVLMTLAENRGPNWSALASMTAASVTPTGPETFMIDLAKKRAATTTRIASADRGLQTLAGLTNALVALTRFHRRRRALMATTPEERRNAELLFVPSARRYPGSDQRHLHVVSDPGLSAWARSVEAAGGQRVSLRRLRESANFRGKRATGRGTVVGHSEEMNNIYLAEGMPPEELARLVLEAQSDIEARARAAVSRDTENDALALQALATNEPDQLVDRAIVTCGSGAVDPASEALCNRGILGCFTCPSGYRTDANVPALKATITLTEAIRANDPDEWLNGPASTLHAFATAALQQFATDLSAIDSRPLLPVVAALYNEVRG